MKDKHYYKIATEAFGYLVTEFGYEIVDSVNKWYSDDLTFKKDNLEIKISFEWYDNLLSIYFSRSDKELNEIKSLAEILNPDNEHKFSFTNLLYSLTDTDKKLLSPDNHSYYDQAVIYQAKLLKELGTDFILGKKWPSFELLSNKKIKVDIFETKNNQVTKNTYQVTTIDELKNLLK